MSCVKLLNKLMRQLIGFNIKQIRHLRRLNSSLLLYIFPSVLGRLSLVLQLLLVLQSEKQLKNRRSIVLKFSVHYKYYELHCKTGKVTSPQDSELFLCAHVTPPCNLKLFKVARYNFHSPRAHVATQPPGHRDARKAFFPP